MTCKDCYHSTVCRKKHYHYEYDKYLINLENIETVCEEFKDKSKIIEKPDTVYEVDCERIYESKVKNIIFDTDGIAFDERAIGKTVFLSKKEAEEKLEELKK